MVDDYADGFRVVACIDGIDVPVHPLVLGRRVELGMSARVQSYCRGLLDVSDWTVRFDGRGTPQQAAELLAHEIAHIAGLMAGVPPMHDERCVDRVAMALWLSREAVRRIVQRVGVNVPALLAALPDMPPAWVIQRVAWVLGRPVVLRTGRVTRSAWAPAGWEMWSAGVEHLAVTGVRATGRPMRVRWGGTAWPCDAIGPGGVVILGECDEMR